MKRIWKFPIQTTDVQAVEMPRGAEIIAVQTQYERPCLWALVDPNEPEETRTLEVFRTGHPVPDAERRYIGTYQLHGGQLVFHVFELKRLT